MLHKTKDGYKVSIDGTNVGYPLMSNSHLLNTIRYIKRVAEKNKGIVNMDHVADMYGFLSTLQGDMAQHCTEQAIDYYCEIGYSYEDILEIMHYQVYVDEAKRRNLIFDK